MPRVLVICGGGRNGGLLLCMRDVRPTNPRPLRASVHGAVDIAVHCGAPPTLNHFPWRGILINWHVARVLLLAVRRSRNVLWLGIQTGDRRS